VKRSPRPEEFEYIIIPRLFSYPRCPKINAYIERYNILYNTTRPHKSLGLKNPVNYMIENNQMSQKYLTYTRG